MSDAGQKALNALAKGAGVTAIAMIASKFLSYLYRITIARFVGPDAYGQLSLALMVVGIGGTLSLLALNNGILKFIPEFRASNDKSKIRGIVLSSLYITVPTSLIITLSIFFGAEFIAIEIFESPELVPLLKIMSVTPFFSTLSSIFFDVTKAYNKIIYKAGTVRILQNMIQLAVTVALVILGYDVIGAAWGWITGLIVAAILGFYFMEKKIGPILFSNVKPEYQYQKLLRFSTPLLLSGIITSVMGWADTGFLGYYMSDTEVGLYNAALPTALLIILPHKAIGSLALPSLSELNQRDRDSAEDALQTATYWVFSLVFPTFLIMTLFSEQVLYILFGAEYRTASLALSILAVGYLFDAFVGRVGSFLQSTGHTKYILYNNSALIILNIVLNIALIPIYGLIGAAIATTTSMIASNVLMYVEVLKKEKVNTLSSKIPKVILTALIPLGLVMIIDTLLFNTTPYWFLFPAGLLYYSLYILIFLKLIGLGDEEKEVILRTGDKIGYKPQIEYILGKIENSL